MCLHSFQICCIIRTVYGVISVCRIYTAGYEGKTLEEFIALLKANKIEQVIDIRLTPISRKSGFSKSALTQALADEGIKYIHFRELGSPKLIRNKLYETADYELFFAEYREHVALNYDYVVKAYQQMEQRRSCLMCYEKDYHFCHRFVLTDMMSSQMPHIEGVVNL